MNEAIAVMIGSVVEVTSIGGETRYTDTGVLEAFDDPWLRLRTSADDLLCFSVHRIRIVKLLGPAPPRQSSL